MTLFRFLLENIVEPIQEDSGELHGVPNSEHFQNSRVRQCCQGAKCNESANAQMSVNDLRCAHPQKNGSGEEPYALEDTVPRHYDKGRLKYFFRDGKKLIQHRVAKCALAELQFYFTRSVDRMHY